MRTRLGTRGLPSDVHATWRRSLTTRTGASSRILAWARSQDGFVVGSPAVLSLGGGDAGADPDDWHHIGWHEIEHGGWNAESGSLSWTLYGGRRGRVALVAPARLPELFRERVAASIVVEQFVAIRGERGVTVTARRDLADGGAVTWHSTLTRGLSWSGEGVAEEAARVSAALQSEYGSTSAGW